MEITLKTHAIAKNEKVTEQQKEDYFNVNTSIENLFDEVEHTIDWFTVGEKVGAQITYTDFLSCRTVERLLHSIVPDNIKIILKREFSDTAVARLLIYQYKKNEVGIVDCINGSITAEPIRDYVRRKFINLEVV